MRVLFYSAVAIAAALADLTNAMTIAPANEMALHDGHDFAQISVYSHGHDDKKDKPKDAPKETAPAAAPKTTQEK